MSDWDKLVTVEKVAALHAEGMRRYGGGGLGSPPKPGCVEGALGNAWTAELYQDEAPGRVQGLAFAGFVLFYLARNHCFTDGNKRVAWLTAMWILAGLRVTVQASIDEAETMILTVIEGSIASGADVTRWLASRLVADPA